MIITIVVILLLIIITITNLIKIIELEAIANNAEKRAIVHFVKLNNIEDILQKAESNKIPAVFIVERIKEVVNNTNQ